MNLQIMRGLVISRQLSRHFQKPTTEPKGCLIQMNNKNMTRPYKISVEGNIGSGKSTFLNYFKRFPFVETYDEPLDKWRNVQGHNLLGLLYEDMLKWSATFQSYVQLTRTQIQTTPPKDGVKVQIFERSVQNNRYCFLENAFKSGCILPPQFSVLCEWFDWIQENVDISLDFIVYLRTSPDIVFKRVKERNRTEEKTITLEYLESIHKSHDKWLMDPKQPIPVFVVDANKTFDDVIELCQKNLPVLFNQDITTIKGALPRLSEYSLLTSGYFLLILTSFLLIKCHIPGNIDALKYIVISGCLLQPLGTLVSNIAFFWVLILLPGYVENVSLCLNTRTRLILP